MKLSISLPNNNHSDRKYCAEIVASYFNCDYEIYFDDSLFSTLYVDSIKCIQFRDVLWKDSLGLKLFSHDDVPKSIKYYTHELFSESNLPILYGEPDLKLEGRCFYCEFDIFGAIFFMLTRFEEMFCKTDFHGRCPATESLAYRYGFLDRPIVNEYIEFLRNCFRASGFEIPNPNKFEIIPTHDVDAIIKFPNIKTLIGDLVKRNSPKLFINKIKDYINGDYFNFLMDMSEFNAIKSRFYFMSSKNNYDANYSPQDVSNVVGHIIKRNHVVGFHPGYDTYLNSDSWILQKSSLVDSFKIDIREGRQHYLRFKIPDTWRIWDSAGMNCDSTLSYADYEGFRCGTGNRFRCYDCLNHKVLSLSEIPLIVMDGTLLRYRKVSGNDAVSILDSFKQKCMRYSMPFVLLFHNSIFWNVSHPEAFYIYTNFMSR